MLNWNGLEIDGIIRIEIRRKESSHQYKFYPEQPDSWQNNRNNNMKDTLLVYEWSTPILQFPVQTVANIPGGRYADTVASGNFYLRTFVDERMFHGPIHGIVDAYDLESEYIDENSVQSNDKSRWLLHDNTKKKEAPRGLRLSAAWSAGCFVLDYSNLHALNRLLMSHNITRDRLLECTLYEVDE